MTVAKERRPDDDESSEGDASEQREQSGRLLEEDPAGRDEEKDLVGDEVDDEEGLTAEEAAMRVQDSAPGATSHPDDYVEER